MKTDLIMLQIDIADTPYKRDKGLMFVEHLPDDRGMLFAFGQHQPLSFWGMNTYIPLDIAFIKDGKIINIERIKPFDLSAVKSASGCDMALEVNEGYFKSNGIGIGDYIKLESDTWDGHSLKFVKKDGNG